MMAPESAEFGKSFTLFASQSAQVAAKTALNVQEMHSRNGEPTLKVELAPLSDTGVGGDWEKKISLQLTQHELTNFCRVAFGLAANMQGSYHGKNRNKGITTHNNGQQGMSILVSEKGRQLQHMISPADRIELAVFAVKRLALVWGLSVSDVLAILRQSVKLLP